MTTNTKKKKNRIVSTLASIADILLPSVCLFILLKFIIGISPVSGRSMVPTLKDKDWVIYNRLATHFEKGDIIIAKKEEENILIIKRVIGMEGDTIDIKDGLVYLNNEPLDESSYEVIGPTETYDIEYPLTLQEDEYFVLGDNRPVSLDSRSSETGILKEENIKGKMVFHFKKN